jgi:hypothetical protein
MRFVKKPVEISAWSVRDLVDAAAHNWSLLPQEVVKAYDSGILFFAHDHIIIHTLEGNMKGGLTDWLIEGVHGEFYACKNDIFQETYDIAERSEA